MKKTIIFISVLALGLTAGVANSDFTFSETLVESEPLRVLFIGNSFTNQIQSMLNSLIRATPYSESTVEYVAPDGWTLQQHQYSQNTMSKIRSSNWDFVVLQEQSFRPTLPDERAQFYNVVADLSEAIKESGAQVVLYMTWGWLNGDTYHPQISPDYETMQQLLIEAYTEAARNVDAIIAPVGVAWQRVRRNNPDLGRQLYQSDGYHPSNKGAFLAACVLYATLFDADPTELDFNGSLSAEEAAYLRNKAAEAFTPNVDFNGDGFVDTEDLLIMIDNWGTDETLCDIAPPPFGDGIVDALDLELLMSYWGQEVLPVDLRAYWKLDEAEGNIAYDSVGQNDALLIGGPVWRPTDGMVDGAIEVDGIDDYVSVPFVIYLEDKKFSIFAWIKGGAPGQTIISQSNKANWLSVDSSEGRLMSELVAGRGATPLVSDAVVTNSEWHRVGLTWDGSIKVLYVDNVEVASDILTTFSSSENNMYIGADKNLTLGSFFSGLIDDVRIYNRAITP